LWDLLSLPALMGVQRQGLRVLVLGVGGGAVIKQLETLLDEPRITGLDIDDIHLRIASRWFNVDSETTTLVHADAVGWLRQFKGPPFDLIIDDLFGGEQGEPSRAVSVDSDWGKTLTNNLASTGTLVINHLDRREARRALSRFSCAFSGCWSLQHERYHNCVSVQLRTRFTPSMLKTRLLEHPALSSLDRRTASGIKPGKFASK